MHVRPLVAERSLPLLADVTHRRDRSAVAAATWAAENRQGITESLAQAGVLLVRGFEISTPEEFRGFCAAVCPDLKNYVGGDSPRTDVTDRVYTSTEYPAPLEVLLHNELSYAGWSPDRVFFGCLVPATTGGETQIADGRIIYRALDPAIRDRFRQRGIAYLQHLRDADGPPGPGKSWQETFETSDRDEAAAYLTRSGMSFEWTALGIRTRAVHPAVLNHPATGEPCWHNQADQWHRDLASVKDSVGADAAGEIRDAGIEGLGNHVTFGDGGAIDVADLLHIRDTARRCEVAFPWQAGDVMIIDNIMAMHGRKPFTGDRRILVAMA